MNARLIGMTHPSAGRQCPECKQTISADGDCLCTASLASPEARALLREQQPGNTPLVRTFATGATRDLDDSKLDFEGFLSPAVLERFAQYMHGKRRMADGSMRAADNWQKGIPPESYVKSMHRHFMDVWKLHRGLPAAEDMETALCAMLFNVQGLLHEVLKGKRNEGGTD